VAGCCERVESRQGGAKVATCRMFQRMYHLRETGELDEQTLDAMAMPRCGMADMTPHEYAANTAPPPDQPVSFFVPGTKIRSIISVAYVSSAAPCSAVSAQMS